LNLLYLLFSTIIILVGLAGIFIPALPGVPLVFAGTFIYAWGTNFEVITIGNLIFFALLTAVSSAVDYVGGLLAAKKYGASKYGLAGSLAGGILGLLAFGIIGVIVGQLTGVILGELYYGKKMRASMISGVAVFIGYLLGNTIKVFIAGLIVIVFYMKVL
jgi:uncharacterized protein YqgC (DUF456 family)